MSSLIYSWNIRGSLNGEYLSALGTTVSVDGVAEVKGIVEEGTPLQHSSWMWSGLTHYGLAYMKGGHKVNPCEKMPYFMTRHWKGEDGAHIWSSHNITGSEGSWSGAISCIGDGFDIEGPIIQGQIVGQMPSHWVATKRSQKEVDVYGIVTLKVGDGSTYTAHVHEYIKFWEPCVNINRHFWKVVFLEAEYQPTHWNHKEKAIVDPNWNYGPSMPKMTFNWHIHGSINDNVLTADGYGFGSGFRQHHWGKGDQGYKAHGFPNLNWALAWEGHAGLHFFTGFPEEVPNPFILSLPEGFTVKRKWWGQDGAHWISIHDLRYKGTHFTKEIVLVGDAFPKDGVMLWNGDKQKGNWIVRSWPQYAIAVPKGNDHIWYRATFQFELNDGSYYSGHWEMDIHFRKPVAQMPEPFVVKFWPETWDSKSHYWHFYGREEVEPSTYDKEV